MHSFWKFLTLAGYLATILRFVPALASGSTITSSQDKGEFVTYYTANTLAAGQCKLGLESAIGLSDTADLVIDTLPLIAGAPNATIKYQIYRSGDHSVSLGLGASYLNRDQILWGGAKKQFDELSAQIIRPQISWSRRLSERLILHTHWSFGFGPIKARLSEDGRRALWESKYPNGDYDEQRKGKDSSNLADIDGDYALSHRGLQIQSLLGFGRDFFMLSGEFVRESGKRILITSRIDQVELEDLRAKSFRLTIAQQWSFETFHIRIGAGLQYQSLSGRDLDGEALADSGFQPTTDIDFYWLL